MMKRRIKVSIGKKMFFVTMIPFLAVMAVISMLTIQNKIKTEKELILTRLNAYTAFLESGALSFESIANREKLESMLGEDISVAELVKSDYSTPYSTDPLASSTSLDKALVDRLFKENLVAFITRGSLRSYLSPVEYADAIVGIFHVDFLSKNADKRISRYAYSVTFLNLIGVVVSLFFISFLAKRSVLKGLSELTKGSKEIARGNFNTVVNVTSNDELGDLADSFNKMTKDLHKITVSRDELAKEITERVKTEEKLLAAEERYRTQFESALDAIFIADTETGILLDCNPAAAKLLGRSKSEIVGQSQKIIHPNEIGDGKFSQTYKAHLGEKAGQALEAQVVTKNGEVRDVSITANFMEIAGRKALQGIFRDITERKKAEDALKAAYTKLKSTQNQLVQAEKLNAVGQLASGVAHEVKNPLGIILQSVNYLEGKIPPTEKDSYEVLEMAKSNIKRADNIIRSLVDFSRASELTLLPEDVNSILENALILIQHRIKVDNIKVIKELRHDLPKVLADKIKMEQVFVNLFLNAVQAMPGSGNLTIRTELLQMDDSRKGVGRRQIDSFKTGEPGVAVEIEDSGVGIPAEDMNKIFDPFFTTKGPRDGAGLGLSVTKNIIDMHKAIIDVESEKGRGTKVTVILRVAS